MSAPLLVVENAERRYRMPREGLFTPGREIHALGGVSLVLAEGETLGVVGESGSGKSTLARLVMAFEAPNAGRVLFDGQDLSNMPREALRRLRPRFQMVFQDPVGSLDPRRPVGWSVAEPLRALPGLARAERDRRVLAALISVGLSPDDANRYPHEFSGGQRQRIAIARAIAPEPALIVADEAVSALDVSVQAQVLNLLMKLQAETGVSLLFISHDLAVVSCVCETASSLCARAW
jgi:peptide/nickel transport system ATP-binding protein